MSWPHGLSVNTGLSGLAVLLLMMSSCTSATPTPTPSPTPEPTLEPSAPDQATVVVEVAGTSFFALVADTPELRALGLSGREYLPGQWGMWFDLGGVGAASFWMRGMQFPLDIVWVNELFQVVHVTYNAPVPSPGAEESSLPLYTSGSTPVRYVLEIGAGLARELGIEPGVTVQVKPSSSQVGPTPFSPVQ